MAKGVSVTLYDASGSPIASETDIAVLWFDSDLPPNLGAIRGQSAVATTTSGGVLSLDLDNVTGLNVGDWGFLVCYKLDGSDHEDSPTFASRMQVASMSGTTTLGPLMDFVRNPEWPAQVAPVNGVEKITGLVAIFDHDSNFLAFAVAGAYTVDWGDGGGTENVATGVTASHTYTYSSVGGTIVGTSSAVAVTFTDSGDTVNRTAHGYQNGQPVNFASITSTTGISTHTTYYVVGRAANTFQVSATRGGSALTLTTDGSGTVYLPEYKVAVVTITPQGGSNLTDFNLDRRYNTPFTANSAWLSLSINGASLATMNIGNTTSNQDGKLLLAEVYLGENVISDFTFMFSNCHSLQSLPLLNTSSGTNFTGIFSNCANLQAVPFFDTSSGTNFTSMFSSSRTLQSVPLLDTSSGTNFSSMFSTCTAMQSVPLLDTSSGTNFTSMLQSCAALRTVPLFDTSSGTNFTSMFNGSRTLQSVPLFDTSSGTNFTSMFNTCTVLQFVPLFDTAIGTNFTSMFQSCSALRTVPLFDTSSGTTFTSMFSSCAALQSVPLLNTAAGTTFTSMFSTSPNISSARLAGTAQSISYSGCKLSAAALNDIFTGLATVTAKTITITNNFGAGSCTTSIATSKGWTVTN